MKNFIPYFAFAFSFFVFLIFTPHLGFAQIDGTSAQQSSFNPGSLNGSQQTLTNPQPSNQIYSGKSDNKFSVLSDASAEPPPPISLKAALALQKENVASGNDSGLPFDIRAEAIREGAISYGARAGLAWRTWEIRRELQSRARYMDKVYNFRNLLIAAPSGFFIEPPVITESLNAMLIQDDGQQAAVSDRVYNIINNAKIVSSTRTWRDYLEREWGDTAPPPDILRPESSEERALWNELVTKGWEAGASQANEIFQDDLNILMNDFQGMVRYRVLLAQGMVSPPYALQVDRGITGETKKVLVGNDFVDVTTEMRVGDRAVQITGIPALITGSDQWLPANQ